MFVEQWRDRHGKLRVYFRRDRGPRITLPADLHSEEFAIAYAAAIAGQIVPPPGEQREEIKRDTIAGLVVSYKRSSSYRELRETTKKGYATRLEVLRREHGHRSVSGLTRERIVTGILEPYADRPGARLSILKMLRILIRHAIDLGWLKHDPSLGIKRPKTKRIRSWTEREIAEFEARWPIGTKQRLAFALMLYTGQRRSDVHRMTWADASGRSIRVIQQKTGAKLTIRIHKKLWGVLARAEREHVTIVNTAYGRPFTVAGFGQFMRDAIQAAGLPLECQPHGLRKAAGRRLAESGCTAKEIMSILGHQTLSEAEKYIEEADQARLAEAAIAKLEGQNWNKLAQTHPKRFGQGHKNNNKNNTISKNLALPRGLEPLFSP